MDMFSLIADTVDSFAEYLEFMFTKIQSKPVAGCKLDDEKFYHIMKSELNYFIHPHL
jgi:hypothetical protein